MVAVNVHFFLSGRIETECDMLVPQYRFSSLYFRNDTQF